MQFCYTKDLFKKNYDTEMKNPAIMKKCLLTILGEIANQVEFNLVIHIKFVIFFIKK